jgi:hypothetical protein
MEYVLATGRPIVFLSNVIKTPIGKDPNAYKHHQQFAVRGQIGPIVKSPQNLRQVIEPLLKTNSYRSEIEEFRKSFVYNSGEASSSALKAIEEETRIITADFPIL